MGEPPAPETLQSSVAKRFGGPPLDTRKHENKGISMRQLLNTQVPASEQASPAGVGLEVSKGAEPARLTGGGAQSSTMKVALRPKSALALKVASCPKSAWTLSRGRDPSSLLPSQQQQPQQQPQRP